MPPPTTIHHHPPPAKIYPPPPTTSHDISINTHHHPPTAKTFFLRNPFIRNLSITPAIAKKLFYTWPSTLFFLHTPETVLKSCSVNEPFILCETSLVLKKVKCLSVENILKEIVELITSIIVIL